MIKIHQNSTPVGTLKYNLMEKTFIFTYDKNFQGYPFGDINISNGRTHKLSEIPSMFDIDDSFSRDKLIESLNLSALSKQEANWEILKNIASRKSGFKGFNLEAA